MTASISIPQLREVLRRSVLTLASVPDSDLRFRIGAKNGWPPFVQAARDAYGAAPPKFRAFHPTARDLGIYLEALSWIAWYGRHHKTDATVRLFVAWAFGSPMWRLQERVATNRRCPASPGTVHNRMNGMVRTIGETFFAEIAKYNLDELSEMFNNSHPNGNGAEDRTDARHLPKSPKAWADQTPFPVSAGEQDKARLRLEKDLQRNRSRASRRDEQRTSQR